jgi:hypothetical protein
MRRGGGVSVGFFEEVEFKKSSWSGCAMAVK